MRRVCRIFAAAALGLLGPACSVTRHIPEGQYLVQWVKIEDDESTPRRDRITASDLEKYVRQTPNKRFLGTNFYVWLYEQADPAKDNRWNNWKRKIGQAPVLLETGLTEKSAENLKVYMDSKGFFDSRASFEVDTTSRRKRARITYRTHQGEPYRIDSISYEFQDEFLEQIVLPDTARTLLRRGDIYDVTVLDAERERITSYLKERGYYNFSVNNIMFWADTLGGNREVDLRVVVKQYLTGYNARGQAVMDNNMVYRIDRIMQSLARSGKLENLRAVVVGHFSEMLGMEKFGVADACAIISSYTRPLGIPVVFGFPAGHEDPNLAVYLGRRVTVSVDEEGARMEFAPAD